MRRFAQRRLSGPVSNTQVRPAGIEPAALRSGVLGSPLRTVNFEFAECRPVPRFATAFRSNCCPSPCAWLSRFRQALLRTRAAPGSGKREGARLGLAPWEWSRFFLEGARAVWSAQSGRTVPAGCGVAEDVATASVAARRGVEQHGAVAVRVGGRVGRHATREGKD